MRGSRPLGNEELEDFLAKVDKISALVQGVAEGSPDAIAASDKFLAEVIDIPTPILSQRHRARRVCGLAAP